MRRRKASRRMCISKNMHGDGFRGKFVFFNTYNYPKLCQLAKKSDWAKFDRVLKRNLSSFEKLVSSLNPNYTDAPERKGGERVSEFTKMFWPVNIERNHWLLLVVNLGKQICPKSLNSGLFTPLLTNFSRSWQI